jgi:hypothetical protein
LEKGRKSEAMVREVFGFFGFWVFSNNGWQKAIFKALKWQVTGSKLAVIA